MEHSPYKKNYFEKKIRTRNVIIIICVLAIIGLSIAAITGRQDQNRQSELITKPQPTQTPLTEEQPQDKEGIAGEDDHEGDVEAEYQEDDEPERARMREEVAKLIDGFNERIAKDTLPQEAEETEEGQVQPEVSEDRKEDTEKDEISDNRRYCFSVLYDVIGRADIAVTNAYTSETRLVENVTGKDQVVLFGDEENMDGVYRYTPLIYNNNGNIEGAVLDNYSGELRKLSGLSSKNPVRPYKKNSDADHFRYDVSVEFIEGDIVLYFTDSFTSEVRTTAVKNLPGSVSLFNKDRNTGPQRYFSRVIHGGGSLAHCSCIDAQTGEVRMRSNVRKEKSVSFFKPGNEKNALRYEGGILYKGSGVIIVTVDTFTSEMRILSPVNFKKPVKLFNEDDRDNADKKGRNRYTAGVSYMFGAETISYALDTFTGEIRIKTGDPDENKKPVRYFHDRLKEGVPRYSAYMFYQLHTGMDIYVLDSFTGEVRIKTHIIGEQSIKLFDPES